MHLDEYAAARRTRLVEHAVGRGLDQDAAAALVDDVLAQQRRRIERADDPDPLVHDSLDRALDRALRPPHGRLPVRAVLAVVLVLLFGAAALAWRARPDDPAPAGPAAARVVVPPLLGLHATPASRDLARAGLDVHLTTVPACEPPGLVLGSNPAAGATVARGSRVELRSAVLPDDECPDLAQRSEAWAFVAFARGGTPLAFTPVVTVVVDGEQVRVRDAADRARWGGILDALAAVYEAPARSGTRTPRLVVRSEVTPDRECGSARPRQAGDRVPLRLQVQPDPQHVLACPLTVDLFRTGATAGIDTVVVRSPDYDAISKWS